MKRFLLGVCLACVAMSSWGAVSLENAAELEQNGFYSLAEGVYAKRASEDLGALRGLLRVQLAQQQPTQMLEALRKNEALLSDNEKVFYRALASLQEGTYQPGWLSNETLEGLTPRQYDWANLAMGVQEYLRGDLERAESYWKRISESSEAFTYAMALLPKMDLADEPLSKKAQKALNKRIKRLRGDDWNLFKYYLWGIARVNGKASAAELLQGRLGRFDFGQPQLILAYLLPEGAHQKHDLLMEVIRSDKASKNERLLAVRMAVADSSIALVELQGAVEEIAGVLAQRMKLIIAQGWKSRGDRVQSKALLKKISPDEFSCEMKLIYYGMVAGVAGEIYRAHRSVEVLADEVGGYESMYKLDCISAKQREEISGHLADAYYRSEAYEKAAQTYLENIPEAPSIRSRFFYQAVLAYLKADMPEHARTVLTENVFGSYPQALLAYLLDGKRRGGSIVELKRPFENQEMSDSERWPIDYLEVKELAKSNLKKALARVEEILAKVDPEFVWRVNFELELYDLLKALGEYQQATELISTKLIETSPHTGFIRRGIEEALRTRRFEEALGIIDRLTDSTAAEEANLLILALDGMGSREKVEELSPRIIEDIEQLTNAQQAQLTLKLARLWAKVGLLDEAVTLCENLLERDLDEPLRNQIEFLKCSLWELEGNSQAETGLLALSQRPQRNTQIAAYARLVGYYMVNGQKEAASEIFAKELMGIVAGDEELPEHVEAEVISAVVSMIPHLPEDEAARLSDWVKNHRNIEGLISQ